jgi:beta-lactamase class C
MRVARAIVGVATLAVATIMPVVAMADDPVATIAARHIAKVAPADGAGGVAVALRVGGRTLHFNEGYAERATRRPVDSDTLFNLASLAKVFVAALLADAANRGELSLDDSVAKHVHELDGGGDIRKVTLGQLAAYSSGLVLPQDHPPWPGPETAYTLPRFIEQLKTWTLPAGRKPGGQTIYSHAGYVLLHLALERRFAMPIDKVMTQRLLAPLGLASTAMPIESADQAQHPRGELPAALRLRAVQGYGDDGDAIGTQGDLQGYYRWVGAGQMYSSARDMAAFLGANLGELPDNRALQEAMVVAQRGVIPINERVMQALAWEVRRGPWEVVDKSGGLNNASAYIGMIPVRNLGIVLLGNRSNMGLADAGRAILSALAVR